MDLRFVAFVVGMFALLLGWTWATDVGGCSLPMVRKATDVINNPEATTCLEFWINRYQTLIGAITSIGAAIYAAYWVSKQIRRTDKQIALTRAQLSGDFTSVLRNRIENAKIAIKDIQDHIKEIDRHYTGIRRELNEMSEFIAIGEREFAAKRRYITRIKFESNCYLRVVEINSILASMNNEQFVFHTSNISIRIIDEAKKHIATIIKEYKNLYYAADQTLALAEAVDKKEGTTDDLIEQMVVAELAHQELEFRGWQNIVEIIEAEISRLERLLQYAIDQAEGLLVDDQAIHRL